MADYSDNIQRSEAVIAGILNALMERGLSHGNFSFNDLDVDDSLGNLFIPCIEWLTDEGIIRVGKIQKIMSGGGIVLNPVLTSLGFSMLDRKILLGDDEQRLGEAVKKVSSGERSYSQFGDFFGGLLGGFTKSIGS